MMICDLTSDLTLCLTIAALQAGTPMLFPSHVNCVMFDPTSGASENKRLKLYAKSSNIHSFVRGECES